MTLYPRCFILGSTFFVNSLYVVMRSSGDEIPTWASYMRALFGFVGRGCLKTCLSFCGGCQNTPSYTGEKLRF